MALFTIELGLDYNQTHMIHDMFKYLSLLIISYSLMNLSNLKNLGYGGNKILNENFISFLLIFAISIMAYYLVIKEVIEFI